MSVSRIGKKTWCRLATARPTAPRVAQARCPHHSCVKEVAYVSRRSPEQNSHCEQSAAASPVHSYSPEHTPALDATCPRHFCHVPYTKISGAID